MNNRQYQTNLIGTLESTETPNFSLKKTFSKLLKPPTTVVRHYQDDNLVTKE